MEMEMEMMMVITMTTAKRAVQSPGMCQDVCTWTSNDPNSYDERGRQAGRQAGRQDAKQKKKKKKKKKKRVSVSAPKHVPVLPPLFSISLREIHRSTQFCISTSTYYYLCQFVHTHARDHDAAVAALLSTAFVSLGP